MIKYILDNDLIFKDYVVNYTNASFIIGDKYTFDDGLFSGYDPKTHSYDKSTWAFAMDGDGNPKKDPTLKDPRCVYQMLRKHYSRYDLDKVSSMSGTSKENLIKLYETYAKTGTGTKAGTIMYAMGWTQHTVGVQNIRSMAMIQLLLGNIGVGRRRRQRPARRIQRPGFHGPLPAVPHPARLPEDPVRQGRHLRGLQQGLHPDVARSQVRQLVAELPQVLCLPDQIHVAGRRSGDRLRLPAQARQERGQHLLLAAACSTRWTRASSRGCSHGA